MDLDYDLVNTRLILRKSYIENWSDAELSIMLHKFNKFTLISQVEEWLYEKLFTSIHPPKHVIKLITLALQLKIISSENFLITLQSKFNMYNIYQVEIILTHLIETAIETKSLIKSTLSFWGCIISLISTTLKILEHSLLQLSLTDKWKNIAQKSLGLLHWILSTSRKICINAIFNFYKSTRNKIELQIIAISEKYGSIQFKKSLSEILQDLKQKLEIDTKQEMYCLNFKSLNFINMPKYNCQLPESTIDNIVEFITSMYFFIPIDKTNIDEHVKNLKNLMKQESMESHGLRKIQKFQDFHQSLPSKNSQLSPEIKTNLKSLILLNNFSQTILIICKMFVLNFHLIFSKILLFCFQRLKSQKRVNILIVNFVINTLTISFIEFVKNDCNHCDVCHTGPYVKKSAYEEFSQFIVTHNNSLFNSNCIINVIKEIIHDHDHLNSFDDMYGKLEMITNVSIEEQNYWYLHLVQFHNVYKEIYLIHNLIDTADGTFKINQILSNSSNLFHLLSLYSIVLDAYALIGKIDNEMNDSLVAYIYLHIYNDVKLKLQYNEENLDGEFINFFQMSFLNIVINGKEIKKEEFKHVNMSSLILVLEFLIYQVDSLVYDENFANLETFFSFFSSNLSPLCNVFCLWIYACLYQKNACNTSEKVYFIVYDNLLKNALDIQKNESCKYLTELIFEIQNKYMKRNINSIVELIESYENSLDMENAVISKELHFFWLSKRCNVKALCSILKTAKSGELFTLNIVRMLSMAIISNQVNSLSNFMIDFFDTLYHINILKNKMFNNLVEICYIILHYVLQEKSNISADLKQVNIKCENTFKISSIASEKEIFINIIKMNGYDRVIDVFLQLLVNLFNHKLPKHMVKYIFKAAFCFFCKNSNREARLELFRRMNADLMIFCCHDTSLCFHSTNEWMSLRCVSQDEKEMMKVLLLLE